MSTIYIIRKYENTRKVDLEPVLGTIDIGHGKKGYYLTDTFGNLLRQDKVNILGRAATYTEYNKELLDFLKRHRSVIIAEGKYGTLYSGKELLKVLKDMPLVMPNQIDSRGQFIV